MQPRDAAENPICDALSRKAQSALRGPRVTVSANRFLVKQSRGLLRLPQSRLPRLKKTRLAMTDTVRFLIYSAAGGAGNSQ